jgi:hypothetical protein
MRPAEYITYRELFDQRPTKGALEGIIKTLNATRTLQLASRLNLMFRHATEADAKEFANFQNWFVSVFFDQETRKRLIDRFGNTPATRRPICHPLQQLSLVRMALATGQGSEDACPDQHELHRYKFGTACLMVSDLFLSAAEQAELAVGTKDERLRKIMMQMLPALEISNPTPFRNLLFRSYGIYRVALQDQRVLDEITQQCHGLDFSETFEDVVGTPIMGWLSLVFGVHRLLVTPSQEDFRIKPECLNVNRKTLLKNPNLTQGQVDAFFDNLSSDFDSLKPEIQSVRPVDERLDLVPFKVKPLFRLAPDIYTCLDISMLAEKFHNGPYFLLSNMLDETGRERVFTAWGFLFEAYVTWLLRSLDGKHCARLYPDTRWENGNKSFDAVLVRQRMVVVMEFKSGFLRQDARYANDLTKFEDDLDRKFGGGCKQLARDAATLFPVNQPNNKLVGVPLPAKTEWVMPVIIVQDLMLETPLVNYFLNQRFQQHRKQFLTNPKIEILPLTVIPITRLEDLSEMAEGAALDVISFLHQRCRQDPSMQDELLDFIQRLPQSKKAIHCKKFQDAFDKCFDEMLSFLCKDSTQ